MEDGLWGKDYVLIRSADLVVDAGEDGVKSVETEDTSKGYVMSESGSLEILAAMDGIDPETAVTISDSIHSNGTILISGGAFNIPSGDDGVHADRERTSEDDQMDIPQSYEGLESATITQVGAGGGRR